jgi:hypothetical protein
VPAETKSIGSWLRRDVTTSAFALPPELELPPPRTTRATPMMTAAATTEAATSHAHPGTPPAFGGAAAMPSPVPSRRARRSFVSCFLAFPIGGA